MSVRENMTMAILPKISRCGILDAKQQEGIVDRFIQAINIKNTQPGKADPQSQRRESAKSAAGTLAVHGTGPIILDEPTRGIDVGAKSEIEALIQEISGRGSVCC